VPIAAVTAALLWLALQRRRAFAAER